METKSTRYSVYNINYHFVWIPKYRRKILTGAIKTDLESLMNEYATKNDIEVLSLSIQPDHIHLFVSAPPRFSPAQLVNLFKGSSARELRRRHPILQIYPHLWTRSYYVGTAGTVSEQTIQHYILECQSE